MTTNVTVTTADKSAKVTLSGGGRAPDEHVIEPGAVQRSFHVYDDIALTVTEITDDSPND